MRLLFVLDHLGPGGAQRQMVSLALGLQRRGCLVEFFIYYPREKHFVNLLENAGIRIHRYQKQSRFSMSPIVPLRQMIREGAHDAVLSYLSTPDFYAEMARFGLGRPPLVVSERSYFPPGRLPWRMWFMQQFHRLADHIVVNSHHQREAMTRNFPWMVPRISTITNGVDLATFTPQAVDGTKNGKVGRSFLVIARIDPNKNAANLVRAVAICRDRYGLRLAVRWAGARDSSESSRKYIENVVSLIEQENISDYWEWLGVQTAIPELLNRHDALIHPAIGEGFPNVLCEALACGRPILASAVGDHPRLIQDGVTGYLFDPGQPEEIASSINRLANLSEEARAEMGHRARRFAERELSMDVAVQRYIDLFERLTTCRSMRSNGLSE